MAYHTNVAIILQMCFFIFSTPFDTTVKNGIMASAQVAVQPLWDVDNASQCFVDADTTTGIYFHGSTKEVCSLQLTAPGGNFFRLQIDRRRSQEPSFMYIKLDGDLQKCQNKYVVFNDQPEACYSTVNHNNIQVNLQGNISLILNNIPTMASTFPKCLEGDEIQDNENASHVFDCSNVNGYNDIISCDPQIIDECKIQFPPNCGAVLDHREIIYMKSDDDVYQNYTAFLTYRTQAIVLDLSDNHIIKISDYAFEGMENVLELNLERNRLSSVGAHVFDGLINLEFLKLDYNEITNIRSGAFVGLIGLKEILILDNMLSTLPNGIFKDLLNLELLNLEENMIMNLNTGMFEGMGKLKELYIGYNMLSKVPGRIFQDLVELDSLGLDSNYITEIDADAFVGLNRLTYLSLYDNLLHSLPATLFHDLVSLEYIYLRGNEISSLDSGMFPHSLTVLRIGSNNIRPNSLQVGVFQNLTNLDTLMMKRSGQLDKLPVGIFAGLRNLKTILAGRNNLTEVETGLFHGLVNLENLSLYGNQLISLPNSIFKDLIQLRFLFLYKNQLTQIPASSFKGMGNLYFLKLSQNNLSKLDHDLFNDLMNLTILDLGENRLKTFPNIKHLTHLQNLQITNNSLTSVSKSSLSSLPNNSNVFVNQHEICECYAPKYVNCSAADNRSPYLTCDRLLSDRALVVAMWLIGLGSLSGNLFVLVWKMKGTQTVNSIFLQHLASSDFLMGIYMLIIASADIYYGDNFPLFSESWRSGVTCRIAGALSIISSEASVFFVTLISIDRFVSIRFPISTRRLRKKSAKVVAVVTWTISLALGIVPSVLSGFSFKFYDNSHVCIGLPLALTKTYVTEKVHTRTWYFWGQVYVYSDDTNFKTHYDGLANGLYFSTAVFLGLNCVCYLIILGCYIEIIRAVRKSSKRSGRSQEMQQQIRLTTRVTAIVGTDFCCWFPVILLGILVQTRVIELPPSVFAWCVTFVLPINSALNPYVYTIAETISNHRKKQSKEDNNLSMTVTASTSTSN